MFENQDIENESPFSEDIEKNDFNSEEVTPFPEVDGEIETGYLCPYCRQLLTVSEDGSYQHEFGFCQAFFENEEEWQAATEKIEQQRLKKEELQRAAAEEERQKMEDEKQAVLGEYYNKITSVIQETLQAEIQNSVAVIQQAVVELSTAKDTMITAITEVTRSSISEKISYYQSKIAETNEGDPKLEFYKDLEDRYNNFLRVFDLMENNKRELKQKIKELTDIDIWQGSGNLEDYQNLLQMVEKLYLKMELVLKYNANVNYKYTQTVNKTAAQAEFVTGLMYAAIHNANKVIDYLNKLVEKLKIPDLKHPVLSYSMGFAELCCAILVDRKSVV